MSAVPDDVRVLRRRGWSRIAACLTLVVASAAGAQQVRGTVVYQDSTTRAPGVVIVAHDDRGDAVARALSDDEGVFDFRVPGAGTYRFRFLRIGYRPTELPGVTVPEDGLPGLRVVLGAEAVRLSAVTVRSDNVCGTTNDAGRVVAQLWEDARTALTATELSVGVGALDAEWQAFQFLMDRDARRAQDQSVLRRRGATERPFVSVEADALARDGYIIDDRGDRVYRAPDATALLSDAFAATHCFRVEPPGADRPQWIGVTFRPTPERARVRDIQGTLWLDRATSELRLLEFRYTNLPPEADDSRVGGYVEYARLRSGHWVVARWAIRTPHLVQRTVGGTGVPGGGRQNLVVFAGLAVTGGELLRVRQGNRDHYAADSALVAADNSRSPLPAFPSACGTAQRSGIAIAGSVSDAGRPAVGVEVRVSWTEAGRAVSLSTTTSDRGSFMLRCVARGVPLTATAVRDGSATPAMALSPVASGVSRVDIELTPPGRP